MEQRKLIKLGNSSFAIALPKDWIDKSGLKKGENIFLERNSNGEIIISSSFKKSDDEKKKVFDFSDINDKKEIEREISVAYVQDYSLFEINGLNKNKKSEIKKMLNGLVGMEIVEENDEKITAKDFFDLSEANMERFVRRMDNTIRSMFEDLEVGIKSGRLSKTQFDEIYEADEEINKFYFLINRLLIKGMDNPSILNLLKTDTASLFNNWWLSYNLEHIGDGVKRIARLLKEEIKEDRLKKISECLLDLRNKYFDTLNSFYKNDKELAVKILVEKEEMIKKSDILAQDKEGVIAKIGEKFKEIVTGIHQINKIMIYSLGA